MSTYPTPQEAATAFVRNPILPTGDDERFTGFGVMGLPFTNGHYLGLRHFPATSYAPAFRSVWHRDPAGTWTFYADVPGQFACARYFGSASPNEPIECGIDVDWRSPWTLHVGIDGLLDWQIDLTTTPSTRLMSTLGGRLTESAWTNSPLLSAMSRAARPMLGVGKVSLRGTAPNGQYFMIAPARMWAVASSHATFRGIDLGPTGRLAQQARLGDFWLPQRGIFVVGHGHFETFDAAKHRSATRIASSG